MLCVIADNTLVVFVSTPRGALAFRVADLGLSRKIRMQSMKWRCGRRHAIDGNTLAAGLVAAQTGNDTAPEARYVMDVGTTAGLIGQGDNREMTLRLGSRLPAAGGHPEPIISCRRACGWAHRCRSSRRTRRPGTRDDEDKYAYDKFARPKAAADLLRLRRACRAGPAGDRPRQARQGQTRPNCSARIRPKRLPAAGNQYTYGDWPNGKTNCWYGATPR